MRPETCGRRQCHWLARKAANVSMSRCLTQSQCLAVSMSPQVSGLRSLVSHSFPRRAKGAPPCAHQRQSNALPMAERAAQPFASAKDLAKAPPIGSPIFQLSQLSSSTPLRRIRESAKLHADLPSRRIIWMRRKVFALVAGSDFRHHLFFQLSSRTSLRHEPRYGKLQTVWETRHLAEA